MRSKINKNLVYAFVAGLATMFGLLFVPKVGDKIVEFTLSKEEKEKLNSTFHV